jgi:hypothetical protein
VLISLFWQLYPQENQVTVKIFGPCPSGSVHTVHWATFGIYILTFSGLSVLALMGGPSFNPLLAQVWLSAKCTMSQGLVCVLVSLCLSLSFCISSSLTHAHPPHMVCFKALPRAHWLNLANKGQGCHSGDRRQVGLSLLVWGEEPKPDHCFQAWSTTLTQTMERAEV